MTQELSEQQSRAAKLVSTWLANEGQQVFRLFGYAGTGKTTVTTRLLEDFSGHVQYCAFTGKAALQMRKAGCENATTIHSIIYRAVLDHAGNLIGFRKRDKHEIAQLGIKLFVVDECSMVNETIGYDLLSFGAKVLVLGDPAQLPPVNGTGFFINAQPDAMLTEVHRQAADSPVLRLATEVRKGKKLAKGTYGDSRVLWRDDLDWNDVLGAEQVLVGTNKIREDLNNKIRTSFGYDGTVPLFGERLVCLRNNHAFGLLNGALYNVVSADVLTPHRLSLNLISMDFPENGAVTTEVDASTFDPKREKSLQYGFDYGYALTVHKSQGSQWEDVVIYDQSRVFREHANRWLYTAITRAKQKVTVAV